MFANWWPVYHVMVGVWWWVVHFILTLFLAIVDFSGRAIHSFSSIIWCCSWSEKVCNLADVISFLKKIHKKVQLWLEENVWYPKHINKIELMLLRLCDEMMFSDGLKKILIIWINELCINTSNGFACSPVINLILAPACFFPFNFSWRGLCVLALHQPRFSLSIFSVSRIGDAKLPLDMNVWVNDVCIPLRMTWRPV